MQTRQPARWGRNLLLLALVAAIALTAWFWTRMRAASHADAAYAAQAGCQCRFAAGRSMESCRSDAGVARKWVSLAEDPAMHSVTASVPALAQQTSRWSAAEGCVIEAWRE